MPIQIEVWGDYACFTRPEMKVERVSYDIMTPSAARGLIESIYWHPGFSWVIDRIHVLAPIRFANIRRNEVKAVIPKISTSPEAAYKAMVNGTAKLKPLYISGDIRQQRATMLLRDVHYVIEAHFNTVPARMSPDDNPGKFQDIVTRRIAKGQFYHQPYFGCREFPAHFAPCEEIPPCPEDLRGEKDLGYMLYDMDYTDPEDIRPLFFRAVLRDGVLHVPPRDSEEVRG